ncbi:MAG TPA: hypothetical protein VEK06_00745 [Myxococcota bacterium]|nr:hypothetical protein [Myxococcota bacterium]
MKNIRILTIIIVGFIATTLDAQDSKNMSLSVDPIMLAGGAIPLIFQTRISDRFSLCITGYDKVFSFSKTKLLGVGGGIGAKFHLSAPGYEDGWYIKPETMIGYWSIGELANRTRSLSLEPRLLAGYEWVWPSGLMLGVGLGIKYVWYAGNPASIQEFANFGFHDFFPNADLSIGWAF